MAEENFDYIVIGSGSAGGVVAARLSEDPTVSVLLLEAGSEDDDDMIRLPVGWSTLFKTKWDWGYQTTPQKHLGGRRADWPRMKGLGGCSSMNAMVYIRGNRADYDEWRDAYGATGWGYDDVLPYFKKAEGNTRLNGAVPRRRRSAARRGPPVHARAEPRVRGVRRRRGVQAHRRLQRRRTGGRGPLPGHLQEGPPVVGRRRLHPARARSTQPHRAHRSFRAEDRDGGHPRNRGDLSARWRHPDDAGQRRDRAVRQAPSPARSC